MSGITFFFGHLSKLQQAKKKYFTRKTKTYIDNVYYTRSNFDIVFFYKLDVFLMTLETSIFFTNLKSSIRPLK